MQQKMAGKKMQIEIPMALEIRYANCCQNEIEKEKLEEKIKVSPC